MATFLLVDDEHNTVRALKDLLEDDGHEVHAFTDGRHAVDALSAHRFDAVLTDHEMPQLSGEVVVRTARQHHPTACIFVSSARRHPAMAEEACHVFEKPIDYEELTRAVAECRARRGPGRHGGCYMKPSDA